MYLIEKPNGPSRKLAGSFQFNRLTVRTIFIFGAEKVDCGLFRRERGATFSDRYPNPIKHVITVGLQKDLHAICCNSGQKATNFRLPGRVQMRFRIFHKK